VPKETFAYGRMGFILTTALLIVLASFIMGFFILMGSDQGVQVLVASLCAAVIFFYGLAPMVTRHSMDEENLILTQGLFFRAKIPLLSIISVEPLESGPKRTGAYLAIRKKTIYVTTRRNDLIIIKLKNKQRFAMAFGRRADTVIFDCLDTKAMLTKLRPWVTPANLSR